MEESESWHPYGQMGKPGHRESSQGSPEQDASPRAEHAGYSLRFRTPKTLPSV